MKRSMVTCVALAALLFASLCLSNPQVSAAPGQNSGTSRDTYHLVGTNVSPCTGQTISYEGDVVIRRHEVTDGTGVTRYATHVQYSLVGVEATTENVYHVQEAFHNNYVYGDGVNMETYINNLHFIAQGPGNNFFYVEKLHASTNASGEQTAYMEVFESQCR